MSTTQQEFDRILLEEDARQYLFAVPDKEALIAYLSDKYTQLSSNTIYKIVDGIWHERDRCVGCG